MPKIPEHLKKPLVAKQSSPAVPVLGTDSQDSRVRRDFSGIGGVVGETACFLSNYTVMPETSAVVLAAWVAASWMAEVWDRFPHVVITSPEKRCGKTTLLDLLTMIVPKPRCTTNISPAALYRLVEAEHPTLLMDESQSLSRRGSEQSEVIREILNAGIGKNAIVTRCGGEHWERTDEFHVYGPKVFAMIGAPDNVLADRCLPILMRRKTQQDKVERFRVRIVEPLGEQVRTALESWAKDNTTRARDIYDKMEPLTIENDRMADLLLPLQTVIALNEPHEISKGMAMLQGYAESLEKLDKEAEWMSKGVRLLSALREIFAGQTFIPTQTIIDALANREEEPWGRYSHGKRITPEALANLLKPYGIKSSRSTCQKWRGYWAVDFGEAWKRYLPPENLG